MGFGRWHRLLPVSETASAATDLDLISFLQAIPDARMRRGVRIPAWYLLLVAVLGILSGSQSLRGLKRLARRHHGVLIKSLGLELRRPPSRIRRSATSSCQWMWRHSARRSVTGRSPRSHVVHWFLINLCVMAKRCVARSSPHLVLARRSLPR